jgi:hypothetical protein
MVLFIFYVTDAVDTALFHKRRQFNTEYITIRNVKGQKLLCGCCKKKKAAAATTTCMSDYRRGLEW